jgi:Skp family chaperone for outer membrane proteins
VIGVEPEGETQDTEGRIVMQNGMRVILTLGAIGLGMVLGGGVLAQPKAGVPPVTGRTRIVFLNLNETLKGYSKFKALREELKRKDEQFLTMLKNKQARGEALTKEMQDPKTTAQRKEAIEQELKQIRFDMDNIRQDAQKQIIKYQQEELAKMYREVYQVVTEYAAANGIDLVMQYNEEWDDNYHTPQRVVQRMNMPFWPIYYDKSMEITGVVAQTLNQKFGVASSPPGAPASGVVPASGTVNK